MILFPPEYQVKQVESHPREDTALVNVDVLDTVLLSLHPENKVKASEVSERTREGLKELHCFNALIHLDKVTKAEMEHLLESLPNTYASQLGEYNLSEVPTRFVHFFTFYLLSPDGLVRHLGLEDDRQGDPWCGEGSWREDQEGREGG